MLLEENALWRANNRLNEFFKQTICKLKLTSKTINLLIIFACVFSFTYKVIKNVISKAVVYYMVVTIAQIFPILSALTLSIRHVTLYVVVVQSLSCALLFATPWTAAGLVSLSSTISQSAQTHAHWVRDAIQPSHPLLSSSPPALNLYQYQGLFQWVGSLHQVVKGLELQLQHQSFQWVCGWQRIDFLFLLVCSYPQHSSCYLAYIVAIQKIFAYWLFGSEIHRVLTST